MSIKAVLFDLGGTLEDLSSTAEEHKSAIAYIQKILQTRSSSFQIPEEEFEEKLMEGYKKYREVGAQGIEKSPEEIWADYYLSAFSEEHDIIEHMADHLTELWETRFFVRDAKPGALEMLQELKKQGILLGLITNTTSRTAPYLLLEKYGMEHCFDIIFSSAGEGVRKPKPDLFLKAAEILNVKTEECAYVGDQVRKDMLGAFEAGYSVRLLIDSAFTKIADDEQHLITDRLETLSEIPDLIKKINEG